MISAWCCHSPLRLGEPYRDPLDASYRPVQTLGVCAFMIHDTFDMNSEIFSFLRIRTAVVGCVVRCAFC